MASLRKASAYSKRNVTPYTRVSKKRTKSYVKAVPPQKIVKFVMGNMNPRGLKHKLTIVTTERIQIRDNALEACRQFINKKMETNFPKNYSFNVVPFPHHIQRENKMLTGAGADRMQTGMQLSYGKTVGKAAILKPGSAIFVVYVNTPKAITFVRKIAKQIKSKLPCTSKVLYEKLE